ncbi:Uncharacterised protein [Chlamydia trachomatis]|nr:Uncharacterised protein [Chlamydia trachomatis]
MTFFKGPKGDSSIACSLSSITPESFNDCDNKDVLLLSLCCSFFGKEFLLKFILPRLELALLLISLIEIALCLLKSGELALLPNIELIEFRFSLSIDREN